MSLLPLVALNPNRLDPVPAFGTNGDSDGASDEDGDGNGAMDVDDPYAQPDTEDEEAELRARLAADHRDRHSSRASWDKLSRDEQGEVLRACADFAKEFEASPDPDPDRVGVPHPTMICKDNWRPGPNALAFCSIFKESREWCTEFLVQKVCEHERKYWATLRIDFELVKDAITRRDGVLIDEEESTVTSISLNANGEQSKQAPWNTAVAHIIRARHWFKIYKEKADPFFPQPADGDDGQNATPEPRRVQHRNPTNFGDVPGSNYLSLLSAVKFVSIAQTLVRMEDGWTKRSGEDRLEESQLVEAAAVASRWPRDQWSDSKYFERPAALYAARCEELITTAYNDPLTLLRKIGLDWINADAAEFALYTHPIDRWINIAKQIIAFFGPPDVWNTKGITVMNSVFESFLAMWSRRKVRVSRPGSLESVDLTGYIAFANAAFLTEEGGLEYQHGGNTFDADWPMGLYDVSSVTHLSQAFRDNARFNHYIGGWDVSNCLNFSMMFAGSAFNKSISGWRPTNAWYLQKAFQGAWFFNQPVDDWTAHLPWEGKNELRLVEMFESAKKFRQPVQNLASRLAHAEFVRDRRIVAYDMFKNCVPFYWATFFEHGRRMFIGKNIDYTDALVSDPEDSHYGENDQRFRYITNPS